MIERSRAAHGHGEIGAVNLDHAYHTQTSNHNALPCCCVCHGQARHATDGPDHRKRRRTPLDLDGLRAGDLCSGLWPVQIGVERHHGHAQRQLRTVVNPVLRRASRVREQESVVFTAPVDLERNTHQERRERVELLLDLRSVGVVDASFQAEPPSGKRRSACFDLSRPTNETLARNYDIERYALECDGRREHLLSS